MHLALVWSYSIQKQTDLDPLQTFENIFTDIQRVFSNLLTYGDYWLAAIVMMARLNSASADIAQSYSLITILAAILGGIDPYGGFGRVTGLVVALLILQTISSGFNLLGFSQHLMLALWGFTLIAVMRAKRITSVLVTRLRSRA